MNSILFRRGPRSRMRGFHLARCGAEQKRGYCWTSSALHFYPGHPLLSKNGKTDTLHFPRLLLFTSLEQFKELATCNLYIGKADRVAISFASVVKQLFETEYLAIEMKRSLDVFNKERCMGDSSDQETPLFNFHWAEALIVCCLEGSLSPSRRSNKESSSTARRQTSGCSQRDPAPGHVSLVRPVTEYVMSLPPEDVPVSRAAKLRREDEDGEDTAEGMHT